eukprot:gene958-9865_t
MKIARKYSLHAQKSETVLFNHANIPHINLAEKPMLLDTGRKFATTKSLFPNKPDTISFLDEQSNDQHFLRTKIHDLNPYFKMGSLNYFSVRLALLNAGFKRISEGEDWNIFFGRYLKAEQYQNLNPFQKVNHFPGSQHLGRKDLLSISIHQKAVKYQKEFDFYPKSYILPFDSQLFEEARDPNEFYISKPVNSSCGRGIYLFKGSDNIDTTTAAIVSKYISNPLLIEKKKFDLRLYVTVTSFDPLRVYLFSEGLVRFSTEEYDLSDITTTLSHLTNYSLNKKSSKFVSNFDAQTMDEESVDETSKWSLEKLNKYFVKKGMNTEKIWQDVEDVINKTIISTEFRVNFKMKQTQCNPKNCFEIYGFDILIDENLKSHLIEVNVLPSLHCPSPLDKRIKLSMLSNSFHLIGMIPYDRSKLQNDIEKKMNYLPTSIDEESKLRIQMLQESEDELNRRESIQTS